MGTTDNAEARSRITAFLQALQELGWTEGRTVQIDLRWGGRSPESIAAQARELTQLKPDVIFAGPTNALIPLQKETRTIPIVFVTVSDPPRTRLCPKPGAPKRQHHRFQQSGIFPDREVAAASQRSSTWPYPGRPDDLDHECVLAEMVSNVQGRRADFGN